MRIRKLSLWAAQIMGKGFFPLLIGIVVGYQGMKWLTHAAYWAIIAGLIATHFAMIH